MGKSARLPAQLWADIRRDHDSGQFISLRSLAKKYNVSHSTISKRRKAEKWKPLGQIVAEASQQAHAELREKQVHDFKAMAEQSTQQIHQLNFGLKALAAKLIMEMQSGKAVHKQAQDLAALTTAVRQLQVIDRANLRMDDMPLAQGETDFDRYTKQASQLRSTIEAAITRDGGSFTRIEQWFSGAIPEDEPEQ